MFTWLENHPQLYEILRYLIAGGLTTLLSLLIHYGICFLLAKRDPCTATTLRGKIRWFADMVNRASGRQMALASIISWVIAVLFAFWINKGMVFRAQGSGNAWLELAKFAGGRIVSYLLLELGLAQLMKKLGVKNTLNRLIVMVLETAFNYFLSKFWIF